MAKPDDFGLDLATRIAMHEILLETLCREEVLKRPNPAKSLEAIRQSLLMSFDYMAQNPGDQPELAAQQSAYGKELSENFIEKVKAIL